MREQHIFRPQLSEILEARAVPSMAGVTLATGLHGISVTLPSQVSPASPQVQAAFKAFDQSYIQAVDTILMEQGTNNLAVPASNQATFHASIETSLIELAEQLVLALNTPSTNPTGSTTPTSSTTTTTVGSTTTTTTTSSSAVANQVVSAIVGGGSSSLESQLLGMSLEEAEVAAEVPLTITTSASSTSTPVPIVVTTAEQVRVTLRVPVAEAVGAASALATANPSTTSSPATPPKATDDVRSAFSNFLSDYFKAAQSTLLAPGQANPQANRAAFDAQVNQSLQSLETTLTAALSRYPATSALGPRIQATLGGDGPTSLKGQLAKLATPQGAQATVVRDFTLGSTKAIAQALAAISADVARFMGPAAGN